MRRWFTAIVAVLCFAGSVTCLWWAHAVYMEFHGDPASDDAALDYLLGFAPDGGILDMNADDYIEGRAAVISDAAWGLGLAAALARLGWLRLRSFRRGAREVGAGVVSHRLVVLRAAATTLLALAGLLLGWMSLEFCAPWYWWLHPEDRIFFRSTATFVGELGAMSLLALLGAIWLLPRRSRWLIPLLVLAVLVLWQTWNSGAGGECLSLPGMLHGGQWLLHAE